MAAIQQFIRLCTAGLSSQDLMEPFRKQQGQIVQNAAISKMKRYTAVLYTVPPPPPILQIKELLLLG